MSGEFDNRIIAKKVRDFRSKLRDWLYDVQAERKEIVVQSNKKNIAVLISLERWLEFRESVGQPVGEEELKNLIEPCKRPSPSSVEPLAWNPATA